MFLSNARPTRLPVTISEPTTLATDYLLGALTAVLASRLAAENRTLGQRVDTYVGTGAGGGGLRQLLRRDVSRICDMP